MSEEYFAAPVESVDTGAKAVVLVPVQYHTEPEMEETLFAAISKYGRDRIRRRSITRTCIWRARDILAHSFLTEYDAQYAIMVDGDMVVPTGAKDGLITRLRSNNPIRQDQAALNFIDRLLSHPESYGVVGAAYFDRQVGAQLQVSMGVGAYEVRGFNDRYRQGIVRGLMDCEWVATGGMRIHRRVFEKIKAAGNKFPEIVPSQPTQAWGYFTPNRVNLGEDVAFPVAHDTAVLGADWKWRSIDSYTVGSTVMGFDENSPRCSSRRMQRAEVTGVINKILPRFRLITNQREIITTDEHPWLSKRDNPSASSVAWKWKPTGRIDVGDLIASVVPVEQNPDVESTEYCHGYVCGMMESDGCSYGGKHVVRMKDVAPLERMATCLALLGIESRRGPAQWDKNPKHAPMHVVGVRVQGQADLVTALLAEKGLPSVEFACGFLAGMFDGDGSNDGARVFIHSVREHRKDRIAAACAMLGIPTGGRDLRSIRIDGQNNVFRFWQRTLPSMLRRTEPKGQRGNDGVRRGRELLHVAEKVEAIESIHRGDVMCLTTTTGTFIADGLASHNCARAKLVGEKVWLDADLRIMHKAVIFN